jgi:hypothetical protein
MICERPLREPVFADRVNPAVGSGLRVKAVLPILVLTARLQGTKGLAGTLRKAPIFPPLRLRVSAGVLSVK